MTFEYVSDRDHTNFPFEKDHPITHTFLLLFAGIHRKFKLIFIIYFNDWLNISHSNICIAMNIWQDNSIIDMIHKKVLGQ